MKAVVLGGTSGIGLAIARRLTEADLEITVTGRDPERLAAAAREVTHAERVDATDEAEVAGFFERAGEVDHLVLAVGPGAAGIGPVGEVTSSGVSEAFTGKLFA